MNDKMPGLSSKEIEVVSYLELNSKYLFKMADIEPFFKTVNEMRVYIHRLKKKGRIIKLNKSKYYLIPIKAYKGHWSEHPFIVIDEIFNGKDYYIGGLAAAHYWGLIEQIPTQIEVYTNKKQGQRKIFNFTILYRRIRQKSMKGYITQRIKEHPFKIASKETSEKWLRSRE
ncbi:MAG: type IV toxin-antitoxin system AbiEi family antitoxin [Candidatus Hydrothermarchaeales archaeon]